MDEAQIITGLRACSAAAHEALYDGYAGDLYDYCHAVLDDDAAAAAALRETLLQAAASTDSMPAGCGLRAWLYALARGQCRSGGERLIEHPMPDDDPSGRLLVSVLGTLTPRDREVLELTGRHGLSEDELEPVLGLPADRVASLVTDARRRFDQAMADELDRTGPVEYPALAEMSGDGTTDPLPLLFRALPRVAPPSGQRPRVLDDLLIAGTTGMVPAAFTTGAATGATAATAATGDAATGATAPHGLPAVAGADASADAPAGAGAAGAAGRGRPARRRGLLIVGGAAAAVVVVAGAVFAVTRTSGSPSDPAPVAAPTTSAPSSIDPTHLPSPDPTRKAGATYHGGPTPATPAPPDTAAKPKRTTGAHHDAGSPRRGGAPSGDGPGTSQAPRPPSSGHRPTHRPTHSPTHRPTHHPTPTHTATPTPTPTATTESATPPE